MELLKALTLSLGEVPEPVVTRYRLGVILHTLYRDKIYKGEKLRAQKEWATANEFRVKLGQLVRHGVLKNLPYSVAAYQLLGRKAESPEEVACCIDPFCYLSHLSAMSHHGITLRMPTNIVVSSMVTRKWSQAAEEKMAKDLGDDLRIYRENGLPLLQNLKIERIGRNDVHRLKTVHWGSYVNTRGRILRVASIGKTFLDMLRNPELCGGMNHVIETFTNYASVYLPLITEEIDVHGGPIDKVRAGYILETKANISHPVLERWIKFAQRGGSRKLDASAEFSSNYSEKWCLSLNL